MIICPNKKNLFGNFSNSMGFIYPALTISGKINNLQIFKVINQYRDNKKTFIHQIIVFKEFSLCEKRCSIPLYETKKIMF